MSTIGEVRKIHDKVRFRCQRHMKRNPVPGRPLSERWSGTHPLCEATHLLHLKLVRFARGACSAQARTRRPGCGRCVTGPAVCYSHASGIVREAAVFSSACI